jgi:hypothetical protein
MFQRLAGRIDPRIAIIAVAAALAAGMLLAQRGRTIAPTPSAVVPSPPVEHAPACNRAARAPRSYFQPLPDGPRSYELHHLDDLGFVDLDCDGVIDHLHRHVATTGPELVVLSYLHRQRFFDYRIPLVTPNNPCEAHVDIDDNAVELVITWTAGSRCDQTERVEHYAIREDRLYLDGRFLRTGR